MLIAFNKPMNVLSQFTPEGKWPGLKDWIDIPNVYAAGRLDRDSEGLLLLTDNGKLQARLTDPKAQTPKTYFAQVEGTITPAALKALTSGVTLKDGPSRPAKATEVPAPDWLWPRNPPIRTRKSIPDGWIKLTITEGRNRQVRRMCAAVDLPCLRLIRSQIGRHELSGLAPGEWRTIDVT